MPAALDTSTIPSLAVALSTYGDVVRLSGADRYTTAEALNEATYASASRAFVATGANFPDALSATVLAGSTGSPLFLAPTSCITTRAYADLQSVSTARVTSVGGTSSLTPAAESLQACSF